MEEMNNKVVIEIFNELHDLVARNIRNNTSVQCFAALKWNMAALIRSLSKAKEISIGVQVIETFDEILTFLARIEAEDEKIEWKK